MSALPLLGALDMARFVARGFLRFDGVVADEINAQFLAEVGEAEYPRPGAKMRRTYGELLAKAQIPEVAAGTPMAATYPQGSAVERLLALPLVRGAIHSLVGANPVFDHHFLHVTFPAAYFEAGGGEHVSQHTHQDSTIDPTAGFDLQIMYYPHEVTRPMGGTRFMPGTQLRRVSEVSLGRYQNIAGQQHVVCEAGTLLFLHSGIWHGGGVNHSDRTRTMFKIRMNPSVPQVGLWDTASWDRAPGQRPIFFTRSPQPESVESILTTPELWFEQDTGRLEFINRIKLWRHLSGDPTYDADYWMSRLENPARAGAM